MEYKVGEIFELNGKKYQVVEDDKLNCTNCCFQDTTICWQLNTGYCIGRLRKDKKDVCFKLVEQ